MQQLIPDKRVRYWDLPPREVLDSFLQARMPAMPPQIKARAIEGWLRRIDKKGQIGSDGFALLHWHSHFLAYANVTWRNTLLDS